MTLPLDRIALGGDIIFQDHRPNTDPNMRYSLKGVRVEGDEPTLGIPILQGLSPASAPFFLGSQSSQRTVGDVFPWGFIPEDESAQERRGEGSWNPCFPAIVISDSGPGEEPQPPTQTRERPRTGSGIPQASLAGVNPASALRSFVAGGGAAGVIARGITQALRSAAGVSQGSNGTRTRTPGEQAAEATRTVIVQVVRTKDYQGDVRYQPIEASVPPGTPQLSPGQAGVILFATREDEQITLFLPTSQGTLISVNNAGNPAKSSIVYDLLDTDEVDPDRAAQLHTVWRVVPPKSNACNPRLTPFPILSWQLGLSGQDAHAGTGLYTDNAAQRAVQLTAGEQGTVPRPDEQTPQEQTQQRRQQLEARRAQVQRQIQRISQASNQNPGADQAAFNREIATRQADLNSLDRQLAELRGGTRTRDPRTGETGARTPNGYDTGAQGQVHACASARMSGPLDVGRVQDPHRIGQDVDGNPINAGHISTGALFLGGPGDGPLAFESARYTNPDPQPNRAPVHLRWDPDTQHQWLCGTAPGVWRLEAETPIFEGVPRIDDRIEFVLRRPDPEPKRTITGGDPSQQFVIQSSAGDATSQNVVTSGYEALESCLGFPKGSITQGGVTGLTEEAYEAGRCAGTITREGNPTGAVIRVGDTENERRKKLGGPAEGCASTAKKFAIQGGMLVKPQAWKQGEQDFSHGGFYDSTDLEKAKRAPGVGTITGVAKNQTGCWDDWDYVVESGDGKGGCAQGVVNLASPELTVADVVAGETGKTRPIFNVYLGSIGLAKPDPTTGALRDGFEQRLDDTTGDMVIDSLDGDGNVTGSAGVETAGNLFSDAFCAANQRDGTTLPAGNEYFYVEDGTNLAAGTPAFRDSSGTVTSLAGGGLGGSTGALDNAVLRADGVGGSTVQTSGVTLDDSEVFDLVNGYGMLLNATTPFSGLQRGLWIDNQFGTALLAYTTAGLDWAVPFVSLSGISDGDVAAWDSGSSSWVLQAGGGGLPVGADYEYLMYLGGSWIAQDFLAIRVNAASAGGNFSLRGGSANVAAGYVSNEANINASQFINVLELATPNHLSAFVVNGGGGPRLYWTGFGGTQCGAITGRRTGATVGDLLMRGGGGNFYAFSIRTNYSAQNFACMDSGILGIADIGNTVDRFVGGVGSGSGYTGGPNAITRMYTKDGSLYWRDANNVVCKLCGGAPEASETLITADDGTGASGATLDVENNVVVVGVPASGSTPITIPTPFVPGQVNDINVQVSVALGAGGGLTGFQVGDGTDVDRWGQATTITLNTRVYRQDWTVVNERLYGFYITITESGTVDIVLTPVGGDWAGGQIIVTLFVHNTTAINY